MQAADTVGIGDAPTFLFPFLVLVDVAEADRRRAAGGEQVADGVLVVESAIGTPVLCDGARDVPWLSTTVGTFT